MDIDTSMAMRSYNTMRDNSLKNLATKQASLDSVQAKEDAKLREQTDNFESLLLKIMLETAIKNEEILYPKQAGSDIYHSMYIEQLSQELSGSFGYSELLFNFLKEQQNMGKSPKPNLAQNPYIK